MSKFYVFFLKRRVVFFSAILYFAIYFIAFSFSSSIFAKETEIAAVQKANGMLATAPVQIENDGKVAVYDIVYWSSGLKVKGKLFAPLKNSKSKNLEKRKINKLPAVVFNHGGTNGINILHSFIKRAKELAQKGYYVLTPSYRGEDGSEGEIEVAKGEVDDAINAVKVLRAWQGVDANRIGMIGTSHGGLITLLAIERKNLGVSVDANSNHRASDHLNLRVAVCAYGVTDLFTWYKYLSENGFKIDDPLDIKIYGNGPQDKPDAFRERSAVLFAKRIKTPLLLIYGDKDKIVPLIQGKEMAKMLKKNGKNFQFKVIEGGQHGFLFNNNPKKNTKEQIKIAEKSWGIVTKFLAQYLM